MAMQTMRRNYGARDWSKFAVYGFGGGLNIKSGPQELADNELTVAVNVYLRTDGMLEMRKGITKHATSLSATPIQGLFRFYQQVVSGAPVAVSAVTLAQVGGTMFNLDTAVQIGATNALGATAQPWSAVRIFDPAHSSGTDVLVICTGSGGPYLYDGTTISTPAAWSSVAGARWCQAVNGILWFGGIPTQPNLLVGAQVGYPETLPATNTFAVSKPVVGMGIIGFAPQASLVVGFETGFSVISGVGPLNFYEQEIPSSDGVAAPRSMLSVDGALYFIGTTSIYRFDGTSLPQPIGIKVEPWVQNDALAPDFPMNGNRTLSWAFYYNRRVHFVYDSGGVGHCNTMLVWDLLSQGWTVLSGIGAAMNCAVLLDAPGDPDPHAVIIGSASSGQAYNWDVYNGTGQDVDDDGTVISSSFITKYFKIGQPGVNKRLKRVYIEIFAETFGGAFFADTDYGANSSGSVVPVIGQGGAIWDSSTWDSGVWGGGALTFVKQRFDADLTFEALAFGIQTNDKNPPYRFQGTSGEFVMEAEA